MIAASPTSAIGSLREEAAPIIIFGAGIIGHILLHAARIAGLKIDCFCDDKVTGPLHGLEVLHTSELTAKYPDAVFFLTSANIKDMIDRLADLGFQKWHSCGVLLRDFDLSQVDWGASSFTVEHMRYLVSSCLHCHDNYMNPDKLNVQSVDLIITERCSMKCKDCSNLMQYYEKPQNADLDEMFRTIDVFCSHVDEVYEFRVIGGEPFMNKDIHLVVDKLAGQPKVQKIAIYTNGTILPRESQWPSLQNGKVSLFITDYDELSRNLNELTQEAQRRGVAYYVEKANGWTDCSSLEKHNRTVAQQEAVFQECCAKNLATLADGKLFRCPFAANAVKLGAVPDYPDDYIDFNQIPVASTDDTETRKRLRSFLREKTYIETCDHCNGRAYGAPVITPAVQTKRPLRYQRYDLKEIA